MKTYKSINSLISSEQENWLEKAKKRSENKKWLDHSRYIALEVLSNLNSKGITQKTLAKKMKVSPQQISKIVKGKENLTLETISKIESALDIKLIREKTIIKEKYISIPSYTKEYIIPERVGKYLDFNFSITKQTTINA